MKKTKTIPANYAFNTSIVRTSLLVARAIVEYIEKHKGTSDACDLIIIGRNLFRDAYISARAEKRAMDRFRQKKKGVQ